MRSLVILLGLAAAAPAGAQQQIAANTGRVYELSEVEVLPRPQNVPEFRAALQQGYPAHLRDAGVDGTVHVAFVVGADGRPSDVQVVSTTDTSFSAPSVQAMSLLRFTPAQVGGQPVAVRVEQPVRWVSEVQPAAVEATAAAPPASDAADAYELAEVEVLPRVRNTETFRRALAREYPQALRYARREGTVQVRFRVGVDGTISNATVTRVTDPAFIQPTLRAVQELRFTPARLAGRPVAVWVEQPIQWSVAGEMNLGGRPLGEPGAVHNPTFSPPVACPAGRTC